MPLQSSGPISFDQIKAEFGGVNPISLSQYYSLAAGLPAGGSISFSNFYGRTFIVYETIDSSRGWSPKVNLANFINIYVVGAGGSGGHGWPDNVGATEGVASGAGGGAGGVAISRIAASSAGSSSITIGGGGAGVRRTEIGAVNGNPGGASVFSGSGLYMIGNGGGGGQGRESSSSGNDSVSAAGGAGGTATGGNSLNLTGGSGGTASSSTTGFARSASGGGAPRFLSSHDGDAANAGTNQFNAGRKASGYGTFPNILNGYITGRGQTAILNSSIGNFDASDGAIGLTGTPAYGAGSGGCAQISATGSGRGGNGIVYIIYEI
jgi:hypothetical protein